MPKTKVEVLEGTLSDGSKVYDVVINHHNGHIEFEMVDPKQADLFSGDLLEILRRHGFIS